MTEFQGLWQRFCAFTEKDNPLETLLSVDVALIECFLYWYIERPGEESKVRRFSAVEDQWRRYTSYYYHASGGQHVSEAVFKHMKQFLQRLAKGNQLLLPGEEKPELPFDDLRELIRYHWCYDRVIYPTERTRMQVAVYLLLAAHTGSRPGAIVESSSRPHSGKCLRYCDLSFFLSTHKRFTSLPFIIGVTVTFAFRKGDEQGLDPHRVTLYMKDDSSTDIVLHLLALAFADEVFTIFRSPLDLLKARIEPGKRKQLLNIKPEMLQIPVLRMLDKSSSFTKTSRDMPWTGSQARVAINRLGKDAGIPGNLNTYCIRRDVGNALDQQASSATRNQVMGHKSKGGTVFESAYWSRDLKFDLQAATSGTVPMEDFLKDMQSMAARRDSRAPFVYSKEKRAELDSHPEVLHWKKVTAERRERAIAKYGTLRNAAGTELGNSFEQASRRKGAVKRRLTEQLLKEEQRQFFDTIDDKDFENQLQDFDNEKEEEYVHREQHCATKRLDLLKDIPLEREQLVRALYQDYPKPLSETTALDSRLQIVCLLGQLCQKRDARPRKYFKFGRYSFGRALKVEELTEEFKLPDFNKEGEKPLISYCVFCLSDESLTSAARLTTYSKVDSTRRHVTTRHLNKMQDHEFQSCPLPDCENLQLDNKEHFLNHLENVHHYKLIPKYQAPKPRKAYEYLGDKDNSDC